MLHVKMVIQIFYTQNKIFNLNRKHKRHCYATDHDGRKNAWYGLIPNVSVRNHHHRHIAHTNFANWKFET